MDGGLILGLDSKVTGNICIIDIKKGNIVQKLPTRSSVSKRSLRRQCWIILMLHVKYGSSRLWVIQDLVFGIS
ncbi:hypothetical protein L1987_01289 [Smallanthus sonchifolius]|uniref:Uncharacterized protein n=1 Tax=Smallanthus sonchifolius TaxID=185202 RepID=A0ACB9K4P5_9ASTR|nr:hypothetical protein L1987_01289 [Smallanthus sonchifolius]